MHKRHKQTNKDNATRKQADTPLVLGLCFSRVSVEYIDSYGIGQANVNFTFLD